MNGIRVFWCPPCLMKIGVLSLRFPLQNLLLLGDGEVQPNTSILAALYGSNKISYSVYCLRPKYTVLDRRLMTRGWSLVSGQAEK